MNMLDDKIQVACFGSGRVAFPLAELLTRDTSVHLTVLSDDPSQLAMFENRLALMNRTNFSTSSMKVVDSKDSVAAVSELLSRISFACVVALVPEDAQYSIARACIITKTPLVTASYVSPRIRQLDAAAKEADIPLLCECGLDPGIDHMGAVSMIDAIKATTTGKISRFSSVCGGLPAPESADNPIGYKFTWSPIGALRALQRPAQYKVNGEITTISGNKMLSKAQAVRTVPALALEQLPNGNSLPYADLYGIPDVPSIFRGTYRYCGFSAVMQECVTLGLLDEKPIPKNMTMWSQVVASLGIHPSSISQPTRAFLSWLGDFPLSKSTTNLQAFASILEEKLAMQPDDRDLVVLTHVVDVELPDGSIEHHTASLIGYGDANNTFMARSVGLTAGIATQLIVQGNIVQGRGILAPTTRDIYIPALKALAAEGIYFKENIQRNSKL